MAAPQPAAPCVKRCQWGKTRGSRILRAGSLKEPKLPTSLSYRHYAPSHGYNPS